MSAENRSYVHPFEAVLVPFSFQWRHAPSRAHLSLFSGRLEVRFTFRLRRLMRASFRLGLGCFLRSREHGFILRKSFG